MTAQKRLEVKTIDPPSVPAGTSPTPNSHITLRPAGTPFIPQRNNKLKVQKRRNDNE